MVHGLAARMRLALDRRLSMSNLPERLARLYGTSPALKLRRPFMPSLVPRAEISFWEVLRLSDLAAEALVRAMDLRKGERVLVLTPEAGESLLLFAALVKAGGVAVPLPELPGEGELDLVLREGGMDKALVGGGFFRSPHVDRLELLRERKGFRLLAVEARDAGLGETSLEEASSESSGFFIPYTLKPGSVVLLSLREGGGGRSLLVMATSRALLHPARTLSCLLPVRPGDRCLFMLPPGGASWLATAVLALCAGTCLEFAPPEDEIPLPEGADPGKYQAVVADPAQIQRLAGYRGAFPSFARARLWISLGELEKTSPETPAPEGGEAMPRDHPAPLLEFLSFEETAPLAMFRLSLEGRRGVLRTSFLPLPPNRVRLDDRSAPGRRRATAMRGPSVTPGWWNDLEASLRAWREGWFHLDAAFGQESSPGKQA